VWGVKYGEGSDEVIPTQTVPDLSGLRSDGQREEGLGACPDVSGTQKGVYPEVFSRGGRAQNNAEKTNRDLKGTRIGITSTPLYFYTPPWAEIIRLLFGAVWWGRLLWVVFLRLRRGVAASP